MTLKFVPCTLCRSSRAHYRFPSSIYLTPFFRRENSLNLLATIRQRQASWTRRVLGVFVVVWLSLALQSCVMAFGDLNQDGCLFCPPEHSGQLSSQTANEAEHSDLGTSLCESNEIQCTSVDEVNYDGGVVRVKVEDAPSDLPDSIAPRSVAGSREISLSAALPDSSDSSFLPGDPLPLNILHCIYLI